MEEEIKKYFRPITHQEYKYTNKLGDEGLKSWLQKEVCEEFIDKNGKTFKYASNYFIDHKTAEGVGPLVYGGISLFVVVFFGKGWYELGELEGPAYFLFYICSFLSVWFSIYYFSMPKKEIIFNRMDGTITFPGWHWNKNITMRFDDIKFGYTTGGPNVIGAYRLRILRPDRLGSYQSFLMGATNCYEDLSFITWYMDKNRPLPPGTAFDEYRDIDFERRKKEGFPKPLYYSELPTPEASPKQQKEREKYWVG
jgi:hypothetical protein